MLHKISSLFKSQNRSAPQPSLIEIYENSPELKMHKWLNYFHVYEAHMRRFIGKSPKVLEIGVQQGGSAKLFLEYLGEGSSLLGVDIEKSCKDHQIPGKLDIEIGNQGDPEFLKYLCEKHGPFDIVIDDGGHRLSQIITSFEHIIDSVNENGIYLVEDTCCQYWSSQKYADGKDTNFHEFLMEINTIINKDMGREDLFDHWHVPISDRKEVLHSQGRDRYMHSLHLYESMFVVEKSKRPIPYSEWK